MTKYFLDANIILDLIDSDRGNLITTKEFVREVILKGDELCTSCDIFTTVYYVASKKLSSQNIIAELEKLLTFIDVIAIDMDTIKEAMGLMKENHDFEDLLQYVCALRSRSDMIITNDKTFYRGEIEIRS
ncbi:MAG: PIN domain-containing protein, partial [Sulfuricurvum sp.]|nr:PIN domain-containing protein [Sulfuricurvum sp.]